MVGVVRVGSGMRGDGRGKWCTIYDTHLTLTYLMICVCLCEFLLNSIYVNL